MRSAFLSAQGGSSLLAELATLVDSGVDSGKIKPMVETVMPLSEARHAHELNETGHARGKIVLKVAELFRNWLAIRSGQTGVKGGQQSPVCLLRMSIMRQIAGFTSYLGSLHEQFTSL